MSGGRFTDYISSSTVVAKRFGNYSNGRWYWNSRCKSWISTRVYIWPFYRFKSLDSKSRFTLSHQSVWRKGRRHLLLGLFQWGSIKLDGFRNASQQCQRAKLGLLPGINFQTKSTREPEELNKINLLFQMENKIYYSALRTIIPGEELKVWYTPHYARKMNVSLLNLEQQSADEIVESFVEDIPKSNLKFYWEENSQTLVNEEPETCFSKISKTFFYPNSKQNWWYLVLIFCGTTLQLLNQKKTKQRTSWRNCQLNDWEREMKRQLGIVKFAQASYLQLSLMQSIWWSIINRCWECFATFAIGNSTTLR